MITTRTLQRIGAGLGLLFVAVQATTLLGPPIVIAYIANDQTLTLWQQFLLALDACLRQWSSMFGVTSHAVAVRWWTTFGGVFGLLIVGIYALSRAGRIYGVFVLAFLGVSLGEIVVGWQTPFAFFWHREAWFTVLLLITLWIISKRMLAGGNIAQP